MSMIWSSDELRVLQECFSASITNEECIAKFLTLYPTRSYGGVVKKLNELGKRHEQIKRLEISGGVEASIKALAASVQRESTIEEKTRERQLRDQVSKLRQELDATRLQVISSERMTEFIHGVSNAEFQETPSWLIIPTNQHLTGMPVLFLSDIHFDEVVDSAQVDGANKYNHEIAVRRIQHTFQSAIDLSLHYMRDPIYEGIVCMLGGDLLSGNIHEELAETNEAPILQSAIDLTELLYQGITLLANKFGKVFLPCVVGNHGRLHHKPRAKNRVKDNFEWVIYQNLAQRFKDDPRVTFNIPDSADCIFSVYNKTFLLTHGDQFKGGTGISGLFSPLFIGQARKQKRQQAVKKPFDVMCIGHWHQYVHTESLIVNGSIKGLDEYAYQGNFGFERPQQALFIVHPELGITYRMPILCDGYQDGYQGL